MFDGQLPARAASGSARRICRTSASLWRRWSGRSSACWRRPWCCSSASCCELPTPTCWRTATSCRTQTDNWSVRNPSESLGLSDSSVEKLTARPGSWASCRRPLQEAALIKTWFGANLGSVDVFFCFCFFFHLLPRVRAFLPDFCL